MQRLAGESVTVERRQWKLVRIFRMGSKFVVFLLFVFMAGTTGANSQSQTAVSLHGNDINI